MRFENGLERGCPLIAGREGGLSKTADVYEVQLLYGGNVERNDGYRAVGTKFNSIQVDVQQVMTEREACKVIEER